MARGIDRRVSWSCNARPDLVDKPTLALMKRAGARMFCVGFEFGNDEMLRRIKKGIGTEKMRETARETMKEVRSAMGLGASWNRLRRAAERRAKKLRG